MTPTIVLAIEPGTAGVVARAGGELAAALGARVVLANVRDDPPLFNSGRDRERARNRTTRRGRTILREAHAALPAGIEADESVELGAAAARLSDIATEAGAALIVVGSRGRGPLTSALLGSVSRTLARQAPYPVMIVPESASGRTLTPSGQSSIVAAMDGSSESSKAARFARELAERLGDRLVIVPTHATVDPPAHTLQAIAAREQARLIVVAAQLLPLAPWPVIVIPEAATASLDRLGEGAGRSAA